MKKNWSPKILVAGLHFDNIEMGAYFHPPITTIMQATDSMVEYTFEMLISQIEGKERSSKRLLIMPQFVERFCLNFSLFSQKTISSIGLGWSFHVSQNTKGYMWKGLGI